MTESLIDQLIFTSSPTGLRGTPGFQVRAASEGLQNKSTARFLAVDPYLNYRLPDGVSVNNLSTADTPIDLTFTGTDKTRILLRRVHVGKDPMGRPGNFFIHALAGLPRSFTARDAIGMWARTSFWRESADKLSPYELKLDQLSISDLPPTKRDLPPFEGELHRPGMREWMQYLVHAFLTLPAIGRIIILAPSSTVATLIWGLTECLPVGLLERLTFSTYTYDPAASPEMVVGTWWPVTMQRDLPTSLYTGKNLALNTHTGRRSDLPSNARVAAYAEFASACLTGDLTARQRLREVIEVAEGVSAGSVDELMLVYRIYSAIYAQGAEGLELGQEDLTGILTIPKLAGQLLHETAVQETLFHRAVEDRGWWQKAGKEALMRLRDQVGRDPSALPELDEALLMLADSATRAAMEAIKQRNFQWASLLIDDIASAALPIGSIRPWSKLFEHLTVRAVTPGTELQLHQQLRQLYDWPVRAWLLEGWALVPAIVKEHVDRVRPWYMVPWKEMEALLSLSLPDQWRQDAIQAAMYYSDEDFTALFNSLGALQMIERHSALFKAALHHYFSQSNDNQMKIARNFYSRLMANGYPQKLPMVLTMLDAARDASKSALRGWVLEQAKLRPDEVRELFEGSNGRYVRLVEELKGTPALQTLVWKYLKTFDTLEGLRRERAVPTLQLIINSSEQSSGLWSHVYSLLGVAQFLHGSTSIGEKPLKPRELQDLSFALENMGLIADPQIKRAIIYELVNRKQDKKQLDATVSTLGELLADSKWDLFAMLVRALTSLYKRNHKYRILMPAYIEYALERDSIPEPALTALSVFFESLQRQTVSELDQEAERWSPKVLSRWYSITNHGHPRTLVDRFKNLLNMQMVFYPLLALMGGVFLILLFFTTSRAIAMVTNGSDGNGQTGAVTATPMPVGQAGTTPLPGTMTTIPTVMPATPGSSTIVPTTNPLLPDEPTPPDETPTSEPESTATQEPDQSTLSETPIDERSADDSSPPIPDGYKAYVVAPDEPASNIAADHLQDFSRWPEIMVVEDGAWKKLADFPDAGQRAKDIKAGQIVAIPEK